MGIEYSLLEDLDSWDDNGILDIGFMECVLKEGVFPPEVPLIVPYVNLDLSQSIVTVYFGNIYEKGQYEHKYIS